MQESRQRTSDCGWGSVYVQRVIIGRGGDVWGVVLRHSVVIRGLFWPGGWMSQSLSMPQGSAIIDNCWGL